MASITGASAGSEHRLPNPTADSGAGALLRRILSALVLIPLALAAWWFGTPWIDLMVTVAAALMAWEWVRLVGPSRNKIAATVVGAASALLLLLACFLSFPIGLVCACVLAVAAEFLTRKANRPHGWTVTGLLWILLPSSGFIWLRRLPDDGLVVTGWLMALVWSVDIAAYIAGRGIGGPKLAPRISPKKTWAGLIGGVIAAAAAGSTIALLTASPRWWQIGLLSAGLGVVEQMGDIAESYAKRKFGAKDSSALIPGHGGLLDRLDGMLAVIAVVALIRLAAGSEFRWN